MLYFLLIERTTKTKTGICQGAFIAGWDTTFWLCCVGFSQFLGAGGEMKQALYAHMNNKRKMKKKNKTVF
jgi:hypothetical protein